MTSSDSLVVARQYLIDGEVIDTDVEPCREHKYEETILCFFIYINADLKQCHEYI